jgi:hypothetical protein
MQEYEPLLVPKLIFGDNAMVAGSNVNIADVTNGTQRSKVKA